MKTKSLLYAALIVAVILTGAGLLAFGKEKQTRKVGVQESNNRYLPPPLPDSFNFCGESVPLARRDIREQFDREVISNYYQASNMLYVIKLSYRHFPVIERILKANGIPDDMKYLCVAESNLQQLVSRVGAAGFWQFMPGTAPAYDLEVSSAVDERYHIEKSTLAACQYLKAAYQKFGSWTSAAASYNCGQGGYNMHSSFQQTENYYDLMLPEETNRYIFRILTFKYFMSQPDELGFAATPREGYPIVQTKSVTITETVPNLATFAIKQGTTYKTLKLFNPWLRGKSLPVRSGKRYEVVLPMEE